MLTKTFVVVLGYLLISLFSPSSQAQVDSACQAGPHPAISFIKFPSLDLTPVLLKTGPPKQIVVQGKLDLPVEWQARKRCFMPKTNLPAVVILHGSGGVDSRGDFYARTLNAAGIATLEIDMWDARGVTGPTDRPPLPIATYPDAFNALAFLSNHPNINPKRIGVLGFSWGGVMTMASATENVDRDYGAGLHFKAHVANYPICYGYNNPLLPYFPFGANAGNPLTGPLMIQIGENDDYDDGPGKCQELKDSLTPAEQDMVKVVTYEGAYHAWDRLMVPISGLDPFGHQGAGGTVRLIPSVDQAYDSRNRVVLFFLKNL